MVSTFKIGMNGFICSECRMVFGEPHDVCPFCGSIVTNYESLMAQELEGLTDQQKDLLDQLYKAVKELKDSLNEGEYENESDLSGTN